MCFIWTLNQHYSLVVFDVFTFWSPSTLLLFFGDREYRTIKSHYVHVCAKWLRFYKESSSKIHAILDLCWMNIYFHSLLEIDTIRSNSFFLFCFKKWDQFNLSMWNKSSLICGRRDIWILLWLRDIHKENWQEIDNCLFTPMPREYCALKDDKQKADRAKTNQVCWNRPI